MDKNSICCPECKKPDTWHAENIFRPFCSERCKLIDLGAWASEAHSIPGEEVKPEDMPDEEKDDE